MTVRLPMSKRKAVGADSSGASQPAAPGAKQSRASRQAVEADNSGASQPAGAGKPADTLMQAIRTLGRLPKETRKAPKDERQLAEKLRRARRAGQLSGEEEAELAAMSANELGTLEEADAPPDPMDPFADEAANRLEQDVLMATNGIRPRTVMRRIARYKST